MKRVVYIYLLLLLMPCLSHAQADNSLINRKVTLKTRGLTLFDALDRISQQSGVLFIFDSQSVNGKRKLRNYSIDSMSIGDALGKIMDDDSYDFKEIDSHVLIQKTNNADSRNKNSATGRDFGQIVIKGRVLDKVSKHPIAYATVAISDWGMGTTTNAEGAFLLKFDTIYRCSNVYISHLGYLPISISVEAIQESTIDFFLEPHVVSIQEVIIRKVDAREMVRQAVEKQTSHYPNYNSHIISFYREGANHGSKSLYYAESVFKVFKSDYSLGSNHDQVLPLKSRILRNANDSLIFKLKAGIRGVLDLDIMKNFPDFLLRSSMENYLYWKNDIVTFDSVCAYAIGFEQRPDITLPMYSGVLYINSEDGALIGADFEINPKYIDKAATMFVAKSVRDFHIKPEDISYSVRYKLWHGRYFVSHIRGDLQFDVRRRRRLFSSKYSLFLELTSLKPDTTNAERFSRQQVISPTTVFYDAKFNYDAEFWENFNYIKPEDKLLKLD